MTGEDGTEDAMPPQARPSRPTQPQTTKPTRSERRTTVRHPSRQRSPVRLTRNNGDGPWLARIRNVSAEGVGLIVDHPFKRGMLLTIELPSKDGQKLGIAKPIKITHAAQQPGSKWWILGCVFAARLTAEEMQALL
jgi:PilZ domain-containing protein